MWQKEHCNNCQRQRMCRWYASVGTVNNMNLPTWEMIEKIQNAIKELLPKECDGFEAIRKYEDRLPDGTLNGRKRLKLWYPNQKEDQKENYKTLYKICSPTCQCRHCQNTRSWEKKR